MLAEVQARREKKQAWEEVKTETIKCQDLRNLLKNWLYPLKVSIIIPHKNFAENILISIASWIYKGVGRRPMESSHTSSLTTNMTKIYVDSYEVWKK